MLGTIFGILFLVVGGLMAFAILAGILGVAVGIVWFLVKLSIPFLLVYLGYRLIVNSRETPGY
jgi:hypothetical protein